jgi:hypothetical protein
MDGDKYKGVGGCIRGLLEMVGFFLAITWPLLMLMNALREIGNP